MTSTEDDPAGLVVAPLPDDDIGGLVNFRQWAREYDPSERKNDEVRANIARYRANFRLVVEGEGSYFVDSLGVRRPFPPGISQVIFRIYNQAHTGRSYYTTRAGWLVCCDAAGVPLIGLPAYGWDRGDIKRFASAAGWDLDLAGTVMDHDEWIQAFPGWYQQARTYLTGRWVTPRTERGLRRLFSRRS